MVIPEPHTGLEILGGLRPWVTYLLEGQVWRVSPWTTGTRCWGGMNFKRIAIEIRIKMMLDGQMSTSTLQPENLPVESGGSGLDFQQESQTLHCERHREARPPSPSPPGDIKGATRSQSCTQTTSSTTGPSEDFSHDLHLDHSDLRQCGQHFHAKLVKV